MRNFLLGTSFGFGLWFLLTILSPKQCIEGQFIIPSPIYGAVIAGDQSVCGYLIEFSAMTGPSKLKLQ